MITINDIVALKPNSMLNHIFPGTERFLIREIINDNTFGIVAKIECSGDNEIIVAGINNFKSIYME